MEIPGHDFLASTRFTGDQNAGIRFCNLIGEFHDFLHLFIAIDKGISLGGDSFKYGGDHFRVRGQGDIFFGAGANGFDRGVGIVFRAAGDHRDMDVLRLQVLNQC